MKSDGRGTDVPRAPAPGVRTASPLITVPRRTGCRWQWMCLRGHVTVTSGPQRAPGLALGVAESTSLQKWLMTCLHAYGITRSNAPAPDTLRAAHPTRPAPARATRCFAVCRRPPWEPHGAEPSLAEPRAFPVPACAFVTRQLVSSQRPRAFPCLGGVQLTRHTPNGALAASQVLRLWTELLQASVGRFLRGHEFSARLNKYQQ